MTALLDFGCALVATWGLCLAPAAPLSAQCPDGSLPPCRTAQTHPSTVLAPNSLAVLYFDNLSPDTGDTYLADGLTDELILRLGAVQRLTVKSRTAVARYRHAPGGPGAVGLALNVAYLVNGSVRRAGTGVRVTVELVRTKNGDRAWGDSYDRSTADLLGIEQEIAQAVTTAITGRLLPSERRSLARRPTSVASAYDRFLKGNFYLARRTALDTRRAIEEFVEAGRLDPTFSRALARIGFAHALFLDWGWPYAGVPWDTVLARGFAATNRALALDSANADAWTARGFLLIFLHPRTYSGVRAAFDRALALDPDNAEAHHIYGWILLHLGDRAGGLAELRRAVALEPERAITFFVFGLDALIAHDSVGGRALLDTAVAIDPGAYYAYGWRARARLAQGDVGGARADAEAAVRLQPADDPFLGEAALAAVEAREGDTVASSVRMEGLMHRFLARADATSISPAVETAGGLVAVGARDDALTVLERAEPRGLLLAWRLLSPMLDPIRSDPRFQRIVQESRPPGAPR